MADSHDTAAPTNRDLWAILQRDFDVEGFLEACRIQHEARPDSIAMALMYGEALGIAGHPDEKLAHVRAMLEQHPKHPEVNVSLGLELLHRGRFREAWPHYDYRHGFKRVSDPLGMLEGKRRWAGEPEPGKTILVRREQGLGDTLQFARLAHDLRQRGMSVAIDAQPPLRDFLAGCPALGTVLGTGEAARVNCWAHMADLLPHVAATRDDLRWPGAYLSAPADCAPLPGPARARGLRVGLAWQGSRTNFNDYVRSAPLAALAPFGEVSGASFFGLSLAEDAGAIGDLGFSRWLSDLSAEASPFTNLARAVSQMDVIVTVCTSIAHLAGGMGKPVMVMLAANPDWRWGRSGETTPWYPSMRLYRQDRLGDWGPVVERVATDLARL